MIDWHSHILPGIDDGPRDIEQSLAMAASLAAYGFRSVYCTPHLIRGCYEASNRQIAEGVAELQLRVADAGIQIELFAGREYYLDEYLPAALEDPLPLGGSRQILVEIPPHAGREMIRHLLYGVVRSGFTPVIAHPERCHLLEPRMVRKSRRGVLNVLGSMFSKTSNPGQGNFSPGCDSGNPLLDYLRELGCSFQCNLGSLSGYYGAQVRNVAAAMRDLGVYDRYGSDLHAPEQAREILADMQRIPE